MMKNSSLDEQILQNIARLKSGIDKWNEWRKSSNNSMPLLLGADLSHSDLRGAFLVGCFLKESNLQGSNLMNADLCVADLRETDLRGVNFKNAKLDWVKLEGARIEGCIGLPQWIQNGNENGIYRQKKIISAIRNGLRELNGAFLKEANLNFINLSNANLNRAILEKSNLSDADLNNSSLIKSKLKYSNLSRANLAGSNLSEADLTGAYFSDDMEPMAAILRGSNLTRANLSEANISRCDLRNAVLIDTNLSGANLVQVDLSDADITGCKLYGASFTDWKINGIKCNYVYWEHGERTPKNRNFKPQEFEELHKHLPTIKYYFEDEFTIIHAFVMDQVVQSINRIKPEFGLNLDSFCSRGRPHAVISLITEFRTTKNQVGLSYFKRLY